jgi:hypothetical protein
MGWDTKRHYPVDATHSVSVKATEVQRQNWLTAADKYGKGTAGGFLAWAGDMAVAFLSAHEHVQDAHHREMDR